MDENVQKLLELIKEHPELPIVPMVNADWLGNWGCPEVIEVLPSQERVWYKDNDAEDVLSDMLGFEAWEAMTEEEAKTAFDALDWIKYIAVHITT